MQLSDRIKAFSRLGNHIQSFSAEARQVLYRKAADENPWFTESNLDLALGGVARLLEESSLHAWTSAYKSEPLTPRTVGVVMAGNIPMVGFHDFLSVLIAGHRLKAKLSAQDSSGLQYLSDRLTHIEPRFGGAVEFTDRMDKIDAVIATGSDNTARYFEYYFRNIPRIIRKNRSSIGVLSGNESTKDLSALGTDVFSYFGLGCRNVSKLLVPPGYDFQELLHAWETHRSSLDHHKYINNYDYQKSILLVNGDGFLDNGFVILKEDPAFVSPVSVVYFEYSDAPALKIATHQEKVQCVVSAGAWLEGSERFGHAQFPRVADYADNIDTLKFLENL